MSEAYPLGLNYGHFGEPTYDSENQEWHFPRQPGRTRELKQIGLPVRTLQSPLHSHTAHIQSATERAQNIKGLTLRYPELLSATSLLPGLAQVSEVVDNVTSSHDPNVSELLAIGQAVDSNDGGRGLKSVSIAAVAGGAAGEAVRLVLLNTEKLGWEQSKNIRLSTFSSQGGEEGWWSGNGSPIQQVIFAEAEGRPSSWLAVRYHGAISVLRPQLLRNADPLSLAHAASNPNPSSRLNANHIVTISIEQANNVPYSDVAFNPWYNQQIATIDQKGAWAIWDVEKRQKKAKFRRIWTVKKTRDGVLLDGLPEGETQTFSGADGWGAVLWAGDLSTIIVASRRMLAVFSITGDSRRLFAPNILSTNTSDWILDVKRSAKDSTHVFVATTSSIFWLQISSFAGNTDGEEVEAGAKCLLSWRHYRDPEDISLSLRVADDSESADVDDERESTLVLLYSCLTGLTNVFTFHYARSSSNLTPSASDPYLLPLPNGRPDVLVSNAKIYVENRNFTISAITLKVVKYESPQGSATSGLGQLYLENDVTFYQLSLLTNDLALLECLYAEIRSDFEAEVYPPNTISRLEIAKTPAKIGSDFIVPNRYVDQDDEYSLRNYISDEESDAEGRASLAVVHKDPWTLHFEWLENEVHGMLINPSSATGFHESLDLLQDGIEDGFTSGIPTMETLYAKLKIQKKLPELGQPYRLRMVDGHVSVLDLDQASGDFVDFLDDIKRLNSENEIGNEIEKRRPLTVSTILTPKLHAGLGFHDTAELSTIYQDLIQACIVPMSRQIPSRVRIGLEKLLRDLAGQFCLASYAVHIDLMKKRTEEEDRPEDLEAGAPFVLPVRRRASVSSSGKGKERLDAVSSPPPASSHMSEDTGFMPASSLAALPTPEPTPSLRSRSSISSLAGSEGPASQRLRAYASLLPVSALPLKVSDNVGQWQLDGDPAMYDYEATQQVTVTEAASEDVSQKKERQRAEKRRKRQRESTVGPPSSPPRKKLGGSQPEDTQDLQCSSQQTEKAVTMSQIEPGRFGGRHVKSKKMKGKAKPAGFK